MPAGRLFTHYIGTKFGKLTVTSKSFERDGYTKVRCTCDCGGTGVFILNNLKRGNSKSCGCLMIGPAKTTAEFRGTGAYYVWKGIKQRCWNKNSHAYRYYGGRGIRVCEAWRKSFFSFLADMGPKPEGMTLDRIDNNGPYSKENCRWADRKTQGRNRRNNVLLTYMGKTMPVSAWSEALCLNRRTIRYRLNHGWSLERALTEPVKK